MMVCQSRIASFAIDEVVFTVLELNVLELLMAPGRMNSTGTLERRDASPSIDCHGPRNNSTS